MSLAEERTLPARRTMRVARWRPRRGPWGHLGVRARVTFLFGMGALVLSASVGAISYLTTQHFLVGDSENAAIQQASSNAAAISVALSLPNPDVLKILQTYEGSGSSAVLLRDGKTYSSVISLRASDIPVALRDLVGSGTAARENLVINGVTEVAVGIPLTRQHAYYFSLFDLSQLEHTLHILALAIVAAGVLTTVLGIVVGRSASARSLRPLTGVSRAAVAIAGGQLDTRLPAGTGDADLAAFASSFNRMVDQLQERIEREERFTSDVSHELRSPLTTIAASFDVLEAHKEELSVRARQALGLLGADLRRFQRMVGDLLEISRSDTGSADVSLEDVEAGELVRRAVAASAHTLPNSVAPPEVAIDPAVIDARLSVDKRRFERVMANLLENAALYGGGATLVAARPGPARADGRPTLLVSVEDHGPGVSTAERSRIFERFYRGSVSGRRGDGGGTGLGLALVAEHVRLNGGSVRAEETDGGGARFVIELPVTEGDGS
ncbi:MAG TPA: HAMP domain-containing sensor histidine kinase [Acidimicrobiales bacterium]|nr:HAMP domain-containing sensor histidine kinase [Acidimicrobiales bacterium]